MCGAPANAFGNGPASLGTIERLIGIGGVSAALLLGFMSPPAHAAGDIYVSNIGQSNNGTANIAYDNAQKFKVGGTSGTVKLRNVQLDLERAPGTLGNLTVTVSSVPQGSQVPGSVVHTLSNPTNLGTTGLKTFDAPSGATLTANTHYFVRLHYDGSNNDTTPRFRTTASDAEDSGKFSGWNIANIRVFENPSNPVWGTGAYSIKMRVNGKNHRPETSRNWPATTNEDEIYTFGATDFPFSDLNTQDTLQEVKINGTPPPVTGTLRLGTSANDPNPATITSGDITNGNEVRIPVDELHWLKFYPKANYNGLSVVRFHVNDGEYDSTDYGTTIMSVTAVNDAPVVTGDTEIEYAENGTESVFTFSATDQESDPFTWDLSGDDSGDFSIDTTTGVLTFNGSPDFENPVDGDGDNEYQITVEADDGSDTGTLDVTVAVTGVNEAPTAVLGTDREVDDGTEVELDGSASFDPEGDTLSYAWTQTAPASGTGSNLTLSTAAPASPAKPRFTAPEVDSDVTLTFELAVSDDGGTTYSATTDTVDITVTAQNDAPTAVLGTDREVDDGTEVELDGSASFDPEGAELSYAWTQTAPASGTGSNLMLSTAAPASPAKPRFTAPEVDSDVTLTFELAVSDDGGTTYSATTDTVDITVTAQNDAPTADAGAAQTVAEGAAVTLDGSASSDPEDAALTYTWTQTAPASGKGAGLTLDTSTDQAKPTFTAPTELLNDVTLTFSLTVNDGTNADSEAATVDVTVTAGTNDAPTADAGAAQTVAEGAAVTLDGSASSDPEDAALTYTWTQTAPASGKGAGLTLDTSTDQAKPTFTAPTELLNDVTLTFSLTVNDGTNADSEAATVDVTVTAGTNDAPTADAGAAQTVAEGAAVTLDGSASSDPEDAALTYTWTQTAPASGKGAGLTLDTSTDQAKPTFTAPTELLNDVTLTFSLTVNDGTNADSEAATVDVTVTAGTNDAPTADAGAAQTVAEGAAVTLDGSASSDPEDAALTYTWTQTAPASGKGAGLTLDTSTDQAKPTFTAPTELLNDVTLTFSLTVNDGTNADSEAATVDVTVTAGTNDAPTADAGAAQTVAEGAAVTLDGSASSDPEDAALTYTWTQTAPASGKGAGLTLDTSTDQAKPTFTAPTELLNDVTLTFSLTVNDGTNADSEAATVDVTVTAGTNDAPTADAGAAQTVAEGAAVTLDGSASSDPEDAALTYTWTQTAPASGKGAGLTLDTSTDQAKPTFTAPTELLNDVTLTFSLTVNDGTNADSEAATVDVTVTAGTNDAPTADAGAAQTVAEGAAVTLDGSASSDPEDAALTYTWTQTAPASGKGAGLTLDTSTDQAKPTFTAPTELLNDVTLTFSLTVNDGTNADSEAATVDVTVTAGTNDAPTADAGAAQTVAEGAAVTLDGSASSDPEDAALTYTWTQTAPASGKGAGLTLDTSTDQAKPTFTAPTELLNDVTLTFSLTVNDGTNADSEAATVDITVTAHERRADGRRGGRPDGGRGGGGDARRQRQLGPGGRRTDVYLDADGAGLGQGRRPDAGHQHRPGQADVHGADGAAERRDADLLADGERRDEC